MTKDLKKQTIEYIKTMAKGKKIAVWGCGNIGTGAAKFLENSEVEPSIFIDKNPFLKEELFLNKYTVVPPEEVVWEEYYILIATIIYRDEIKERLLQEGLVEREDFCVFQKYMTEGDPIDTLCRYLVYLQSKCQCKTLVLLAPDVHRITAPSNVEKAMRYLGFFVTGMNPHLTWLQSNPKHFESVLADKDYQPKDIENLFKYPAMAKNGKYVSSPESKAIHYHEGYRFTTDVPLSHKIRAFFFGPSTMVGLGVEDKYTIPSCFQRIMNTCESNPCAVHNFSGPSKADDLLSLLLQIEPQEGDLYILEFLFDLTVVERVADYNVPYYDLQYLFQRPHDMGEVFYDNVHVNHVANQKIAEKAFELCFYKKKEWSSEDGAAIAQKKAADNPPSPKLAEYVSRLKKIRDDNAGKYPEKGKGIGAIVVNCNPFTLGHRYLIEYAANLVDFLYVFVVQENRSFFDFDTRFALVAQGVRDLENVSVLPSGNFIISTETLPEYFEKDQKPEVTVDATMDLEIFGEHIAPALKITCRFVGEEPFDPVTRQYNGQMKVLLPKHGMEVFEIPRKEESGMPISASRVRGLLEEENWDEIARLVPPTTLAHLRKNKNKYIKNQVLDGGELAQ